MNLTIVFIESSCQPRIEPKHVLNINLKNQISQSSLNHFARFKVHGNQHCKIFNKHSMVLKNKRVENLLDLEEICATVMFGCCKLKQMQVQACNDEWWSYLSSVLLVFAWINFYHWRMLEENRTIMTFQLENDAWKWLTSDGMLMK